MDVVITQKGDRLALSGGTVIERARVLFALYVQPAKGDRAIMSKAYQGRVGVDAVVIVEFSGAGAASRARRLVLEQFS